MEGRGPQKSWLSREVPSFSWAGMLILEDRWRCLPSCVWEWEDKAHIWVGGEGGAILQVIVAVEARGQRFLEALGSRNIS